MKTLLTLFFSLCLAVSMQAQGYVEAVTDFSSPSTAEGDGTIGYTFRANANLTVVDLGVFSYIVNSGASSMRVGLWDASGNLLAERLITSASPLIGTSRYETLDTAVSLSAMQVYHIGAFFTGAPNSYTYNIVGTGFGGSVTTSPGVELMGFAMNTNGFAFPAAASGGQGAYAMTANFRIPNVPEPATAGLLLLGGLALAFLRSRSIR